MVAAAASLDDDEIDEELGDAGVLRTSEPSGTLELAGDGRGWLIWVVEGGGADVGAVFWDQSNKEGV